MQGYEDQSVGDGWPSHASGNNYQILRPCLSTPHSPMSPFVPFEFHSMWMGNVVKM